MACLDSSHFTVVRRSSYWRSSIREDGRHCAYSYTPSTTFEDSLSENAAANIGILTTQLNHTSHRQLFLLQWPSYIVIGLEDVLELIGHTQDITYWEIRADWRTCESGDKVVYTLAGSASTDTKADPKDQKPMLVFSPGTTEQPHQREKTSKTYQHPIKRLNTSWLVLPIPKPKVLKVFARATSAWIFSDNEDHTFYSTENP